VSVWESGCASVVMVVVVVVDVAAIVEAGQTPPRFVITSRVFTRHHHGISGADCPHTANFFGWVGGWVSCVCVCWQATPSQSMREAGECNHELLGGTQHTLPK
jgi:hypothetical protein